MKHSFHSLFFIFIINVLEHYLLECHLLNVRDKFRLENLTGLNTAFLTPRININRQNVYHDKNNLKHFANRDSYEISAEDYTEKAFVCIQRMMEEADQRGSSYIDGEYLLYGTKYNTFNYNFLGILKDGIEGVIGKVLDDLKIVPDQLISTLSKYLDNQPKMTFRMGDQKVLGRSLQSTLLNSQKLKREYGVSLDDIKYNFIYSRMIILLQNICSYLFVMKKLNF